MHCANKMFTSHRNAGGEYISIVVYNFLASI